MKENTKASNRRQYQKLFTDRVFVGEGVEACSINDITNIMAFPKIASLERVEWPTDLLRRRKSKSHNKPQYNFINFPVTLHLMDGPIDFIKQCADFLVSGGYLVLTVPDEDLYEVGQFPSIRNGQCKRTFSIYKEKSWSPVHISLLSELQNLPEYEIVKLELVDTNFDYNNIKSDQTFDANAGVECFIEIVLKKV